VRNIVDELQSVTRAIVLGNKVVVGAINGWAVGGGFEWAINCDLPIWGESARAFFPELKWGMFVTGGVTSILPKIVGLTKAKEMIILGERYGAQELLELGLAWRVAADDRLMAEAEEVAGRIAELPPKAVTDFKRVISRASSQDVETAMALETEAAIRGSVDPDSIARIKEFGS
jgi:enoyl-CoA hydratase/carnithine racemase